MLSRIKKRKTKLVDDDFLDATTLSIIQSHINSSILRNFYTPNDHSDKAIFGQISKTTFRDDLATIDGVLNLWLQERPGELNEKYSYLQGPELSEPLSLLKSHLTKKPQHKVLYITKLKAMILEAHLAGLNQKECADEKSAVYQLKLSSKTANEIANTYQSVAECYEQLAEEGSDLNKARRFGAAFRRKFHEIKQKSQSHHEKFLANMGLHKLLKEIEFLKSQIALQESLQTLISLNELIAEKYDKIRLIYEKQAEYIQSGTSEAMMTLLKEYTSASQAIKEHKVNKFALSEKLFLQKAKFTESVSNIDSPEALFQSIKQVRAQSLKKSRLPWFIKSLVLSVSSKQQYQHKVDTLNFINVIKRYWDHCENTDTFQNAIFDYLEACSDKELKKIHSIFHTDQLENILHVGMYYGSGEEESQLSFLKNDLHDEGIQVGYQAIANMLKSIDDAIVRSILKRFKHESDEGEPILLNKHKVFGKREHYQLFSFMETDNLKNKEYVSQTISPHVLSFALKDEIKSGIEEAKSKRAQHNSFVI